MTHASDQDSSPQKLSPTAKKMLELREQVIEEWERRVRESVTQAEDLQHPVLIDTLPSFYDNLAQVVSASYPRSRYGDGSSLASEHGGERARLTAYDYQSLVSEYQILRRTLLDALHDAGLQLNHDEVAAINGAIDEGIKESVKAFALVHSSLQERFVAALTHDLRGPLSAASLSLELILLSSEPAKMKLFAARASDNIGRVDGMIQELLDSLAYQHGHRLKLDISEFDVMELVKEVQGQAVTASGARFRCLGNSVRGWWGRDSLRRSLENLLSNAVKYGDQKAPISVKVEQQHGRLLLSVHNEGDPLPTGELENIFGMFQRAHEPRSHPKRGWGIGLPYVRSVAESHGGSIIADSGEGRGTTFTMDLPIDARPFLDAPVSVATGETAGDSADNARKDND